MVDINELAAQSVVGGLLEGVMPQPQPSPTIPAPQRRLIRLSHILGVLQRQTRREMPEGFPPLEPTIEERVRPPVGKTAPWYEIVAEKIGAPFEWIQENLEEPWAASITAPLSPELPWEPGETWLEHQRREYEAWEAPWGVKGLSELSMPLWWLPYFGWAAKGAGLIPKIGGSLGKGIIGAERALAYPITKPLELAGRGTARIIKLPAFEKIREKIFTADRFNLLARQLAKLPGFKGPMNAVNPSALAEGLAQESKIVYGGLREMASNSVNMSMAYLERHPNVIKAFGIDDLTRCARVTPKDPKAPMTWMDIFSNRGAYNLTPRQSSYLDDYERLIDDAVAYMEEVGIKINKKDFAEGMRYIPRVVKGKQGLLDSETGIFRPIGTANEPDKWIEIPLRAGMARGIGAKPFFMRPRFYDVAEEAVQKGLRYGQNPNETMGIFLNGAYRMIVDKTVADALKPLGKTIKELTPFAMHETVRDAAIRHGGLKRIVAIAPRARRGEAIPEATLKAIDRTSPEFAKRIREALTLTGEERSKVFMGIRKEAEAVRKKTYAELQAAVSARTRHYKYARRMPGMRAIGQPFAAGRMFPDAIANDINSMLRDRAMPVFTKMSDINALSRFMVTGFDFGAGLIQGVPLLMSRPDKWAKAMSYSLRAFADPKIRARYLARPENAAIMERLIPEGMLIGNAEWMEAVAGGGLMNRAPEMLKSLTGIQRWSSSFNTFGDVARIEWAKALLPMIDRQGKSVKELVAFINKGTGVMSSRALGVGATQRQIESAVLLFAPRYFRANISLWADMMRGGLRGTLARDTLASMMMGGFFWYYGVCKALGQEPNLDPSSGKFMTAQIGNQHIGLGSMQVAMFRLLGNIYRTATEDPSGFISLDSRDNPLMRFARSRVAPITGASWDVVTGKTFIGEPIDTPMDFATQVVSDRMLPFWLSGYISDYPKPGWAQLPGEMFGMRTWPLQLWEKRDELRERLARADFEKPWYSIKGEVAITELEKRQLEDKYPDLKQITEATELMRLERGGVEEQTWHAYSEDRKRAREEYEGNLWGAQDMYDRNEIDGAKFRDLVSDSGAELRGAYRNIEGNPMYSDIMEYFEQPMTERQIKDTPMEDIAFDVYASLMFSGDLEDEAGQYDFEEAERRKAVFIAQWGEPIYNYVRQRLAYGKNIPPLMKELYRSREALQEYWKIYDDVKYSRPKWAEVVEAEEREVDPTKALELRQTKEYKAFRAELTRRREQLRQIDPMIEYYLLKFGYVTRALNPRAERMFRQGIEPGRVNGQREVMSLIAKILGRAK